MRTEPQFLHGATVVDRSERTRERARSSIGPVTTNAAPSVLNVLVYSNDADTRSQVILSLGRRVHPDLPELEYIEVATEPMVWQRLDAGGVDLVILDGEAAPAGGLGIARQMKNEIYQAPPALVITGREQDAWLATWSRADAMVSHPIDPIDLAEAVIGLIGTIVPATA